MAEETISTLPAENKPGTQPTGDATGINGGAAFATFATEAEFQARVDALLKERLERAERKHKDAADAAARKAADDAAKAQGEWQKLAEQYEPQAKRAEALEKFIAGMVEAETAAVPEKFKALVPAFDDPLAKLDWLRTARSAGMFAPLRAPNTDAGEGAAGQPARPQTGGLSNQEFAAVYGLNPQFVK